MSRAARIAYERFNALAPGAAPALRGLSKIAGEAGLEKPLIELVKLRASQINGCAFCIQHHLNEARKVGLSQEKLDLVAAWRDAGIFSDRECAALALIEALTRLSGEEEMDRAYASALANFTEEETIFLTIAAAAINAWNRLGVGLRFEPPLAAHTSRDGRR